MEIRVILFFCHSGICWRKLTVMRTFEFPAPAPSLMAPFLSLTMKHPINGTRESLPQHHHSSNRKSQPTVQH